MQIKSGQVYRHYKSTWWNDYTYEVIGLARHTETSETLVVYKPLYIEQATSGDHRETVQDFMAEVGADYCVRPLVDRIGQVEWGGQKMQRFSLVI